ncbi:MAG: serine/threonine-protein phosphatase, partial [Oscillospiraceae bacterium]|nr:serine/threonine-protein phosphatase [Oscillospiraceae bacterium]
ALNYIISAGTDVGLKKDVNQDSLFVRVIRAGNERMVLAVVCDGLGGLARGELASAALVNAFTDWMNSELPALTPGYIEPQLVRRQWETVITRQNGLIMDYGRQNGIRLGTTIAALLLTDRRYYIVNVGDCRVYEITGELRRLTTDQTVVAREVALGYMTPQEADADPRRNILLQCVGASDAVVPDFFFGETKQNAVYMLCSDGFRHELTPRELLGALSPDELTEAETMKLRLARLIELNKRRGEQDNISAIAVRTF